MGVKASSCKTAQDRAPLDENDMKSVQNYISDLRKRTPPMIDWLKEWVKASPTVLSPRDVLRDRISILDDRNLIGDKPLMGSARYHRPSVIEHINQFDAGRKAIKDLDLVKVDLDKSNQDNAKLQKWTTNPRFWTGIGIGAGIPLVAYGAKKLYDYATTPEKKKQVKVASQGPVKNPILEQLLQAKTFSDKKKFQEKQRILRKLMSSYPEDFFVDSKLNDKFIGLTHRPTNFQLHLPATAVPQEVQSTYVK